MDTHLSRPMGRRLVPRRRPPCRAGDMAMLLYEAPSGIAIFSFDGAYLNDPAKSLKEFVKKMVPSPIDIANSAIDDHLAKMLTELCGCEKTLVVGNAEYKKIIEMNLEITCLYVDVPDCEVITWSLINSKRTLLGFSAGDMAMLLLYRAPTGIAIFSFDGGYLNDPVKNFWECLPPLSLKEFIKNETVPSPIDTTNKAIDDHLAKRLTELCGSEKKLVVGNAEYKRIIEMNLGIPCLDVHVPDCEVIICSLKNTMYTLFPRKLSNPDEDLTLFLKQHHIGFKPKMVNSSIIKEARSLHKIESREKEHLKFFRLLLKDFLVKSGIDAKDWVSIQFATALKVICYPGASYGVYHPDKIFPCGVCPKIKDHASGYDIIFAKIDVLSVYNDVISLNSEKYLLLSELDILVMKAKEDLKTALCTGSKVRKEASTNVDGRLYSELDSSCESQEHDVKQTLTILEENPPVQKPRGLCNEEICNKENEGQHCLDRRIYPDVPPRVLRRLFHRVLSFIAGDMAMLLFQAPSGIAIFSFDGVFLNNPLKYFWECLPPLTLKAFIDNEKVPSPIDIANNTIDDHLAKRLTELCFSEKKLVVGNAEYKRIIETNLTITCLHVDVPDCEVIISSRMRPIHTLLPGKLPDPAEGLTFFLRQHGIYFNLEMVDDSIVGAAHQLYQIESRENEYLKFLRLLLKDFMIISGIDTKDWISIKFATALKMICYPGASYRAYHPHKIFSFHDHLKIKAHASGYDIIFSKVDVLSVYSNVISLILEKYSLLYHLYAIRLRKKPNRAMLKKKTPNRVTLSILEDNPPVEKPNRANLLTGFKVRKKTSSNVDGKLDSELDFSCERQEHDVKLTILEDNPPMEKPSGLCSEEICNKENDPGQQVISNPTIEALSDSGQQVNPEISIDLGQQVISIDPGQQMISIDPGLQGISNQTIDAEGISNQTIDALSDPGQQVNAEISIDPVQQVISIDPGQQVISIDPGQQVISIDPELQGISNQTIDAPSDPGQQMISHQTIDAEGQHCLIPDRRILSDAPPQVLHWLFHRQQVISNPTIDALSDSGQQVNPENLGEVLSAPLGQPGHHRHHGPFTAVKRPVSRDRGRPLPVPLQPVREQLGRGSVHGKIILVDHAETNCRSGGVLGSSKVPGEDVVNDPGQQVISIDPGLQGISNQTIDAEGISNQTIDALSDPGQQVISINPGLQGISNQTIDAEGQHCLIQVEIQDGHGHATKRRTSDEEEMRTGDCRKDHIQCWRERERTNSQMVQAIEENEEDTFESR